MAENGEANCRFAAPHICAINAVAAEVENRFDLCGRSANLRIQFFISEENSMSKKTITPVAAVVGAALVGGLSVADMANAAENPFGATQLESGYMMLAGTDTEGKCGEGKCGEGMDMGDDKEGDDGKGAEGKCGEGKCGGDKG